MNSRLGLRGGVEEPQGSGEEWGVTENGNWVSFWVMKCFGTRRRWWLVSQYCKCATGP